MTVQQYQQASWSGLIALWKTYNMHLAHVVSAIPDDVLQEPRSEHTQDKTAWRTVSKDTPVSLAYMIRDYYGHLQEHLRQLFSVGAQ